MTTPTFSLAMCQKLTSLVPEMEGHWYWYSEFEHTGGYGKKKLYGEPWVMCEEAERGGDSIGEYTGTRICPAWQVEDLLRNSHKLFGDKEMIVCKKIAWFFVAYQDTAYQKIEEYLWEILK